MPVLLGTSGQVWLLTVAPGVTEPRTIDCTAFLAHSGDLIASATATPPPAALVVTPTSLNFNVTGTALGSVQTLMFTMILASGQVYTLRVDFWTLAPTGTGSVNASVIDTLTSFDGTAALSANQGRILEGQIAGGLTYNVNALAGQTVFSLPGVTNALNVAMFVNGAEYVTPSAITISGSTVTWFGPFALAPSDVISFTYHQ